MKITKRIFRRTKKRSSKRKKKYNKSKKTCIKGAGGRLGINISRNMTLHQASAQGLTSLVKELIKIRKDRQEDPMVNEKDSASHTPLYLACREGHTETAITLIEKGADMEAKNSEHMTPLHIACREGHTETAITLIEKGADISVATSGITPLHSACIKNDIKIVKALVEKGAIIYEGVLISALILNNADIIKVLLENIKSIPEEACGSTLNVEIVKTLIDKGANPKFCVTDVSHYHTNFPDIQHSISEISEYIKTEFRNSEFLNRVYEGTEHADIVKEFNTHAVSDADLYKALYIIVLTNNIPLLEALIEGVGFEKIMKYKSSKKGHNIYYLFTEISRPEMLKMLKELK